MIVAPGLHRHARAPAGAGLRACRDHRERIAGGGGGRVHLGLLHAQYQAGERQPHGDQLHCGARAEPGGGQRVSHRRHHQRQRGRGAGGHRRHEGRRRGGHFRRRSAGHERARNAARHGVRALLRFARDPALRRPEPQRRRRYARGGAIGALGAARHPRGVRRRHGGARPAAGRAHRRALSRGAHLHAPRRGHGGLRAAPRACR